MGKAKGIAAVIILFCILMMTPLNYVFAADINLTDTDSFLEEKEQGEINNPDNDTKNSLEDNKQELSGESPDMSFKDEDLKENSKEEGIIPAEDKIQSTQSYIRENINTDYTRLMKLEEADALLIKQTFAKKSLMPKDNLTLNGLWERKEGEGIESFGRAFITVNESAVYMYNTDDESEYFVAYINPMAKDSDIETVDVVFAKNNLRGEVYNDCIYDSSTGIAYIPKKYNTEAVGRIRDENGKLQEFTGIYFNSQCQLLQLVNSKETPCEVDVVVKADNVENSIRDEVCTEGIDVSRIIDMETVISITDTPDLLNSVSDDEIAVYVDDGEIPWDNVTIDRGRGTVTIPVAPSNIDSVRIEIRGETVFTKIMNKLTGMIKPLRAMAATTFLGGKPINTLPFIWRYKGNIEDLKNILDSSSRISRANAENFGVVYDRGQIQPGIDTTNSELYLKARQDISYMLGKFDENPSVYHPDGETPDYYHDITDKGRPLADYIMGRGAIPDLDSMNNSINPMFSIILPNEFSLSAGGKSIDIIIEDEKDNPNLKYVKRNDGCVVIPMQCVHIESPLGIKEGTPGTWTNITKPEELEAANTPHNNDIVAVRAMDYRIGDNGSGEVLISIISQRAFDQTGISIFAVPFKRAAGSLNLKKKSSDSVLTDGNSLYSLAGLTFGVYEDKGNDESIENAKNDVNRIGTLICDDSGDTNTLENLVAGKYLVKELENTARENSGYELNHKIYRVNIGIDSTANIEIENIPKAKPIKIKIQKIDSVTGKAYPQGLGSFKGAEYTVKYYSVFPEDSGERDENNKVIYKDPALDSFTPFRTWVYATDEAGVIELSDSSYKVGGDDLYLDKNNQIVLPRGAITIEETKAPYGHGVEKKKYVFLVDGEASTPVTENIVVREPVIYGGILITKYDLELDSSEALLNEGLSNIEFTIYNNSKRAIDIKGKTYKNGEAVYKIKTTYNKEQKNYTASTNSDALPTGSYIVKESKSNSFYNQDDTSYIVEIGGSEECNGKLVNLDINGKELIFKNRIKRRDIELEKMADSSLKRLSVAFLLTNNNTKESHILVSDENGELDTSSSFNKHDYMTNDNDRLYFDEAGNVIYDEAKPIKSGAMNTESGVYFGVGENGSKVKPDNSMGALPYGEYSLRELRCEDNIGYKLLNIDFKVNRDMPYRPIDLSAVTNDPYDPPAVKKYIVDKGELINSKIVDCSQEYRYRLYLQANDTDIKDIEFVDMIEKFGGISLGEYKDIDTSFMKKSGFIPSITYTDDNGKSWSKNPGKCVEGVKISLNNPLKKGESVYVDILMTAPKEASDITAYNEYTLFYHEGNIRSNRVSVSMEKRENIETPSLSAPHAASGNPAAKEAAAEPAKIFPVPKTGEGIAVYLAVFLIIAGIFIISVYEKIKRRKG